MHSPGDSQPTLDIPFPSILHQAPNQAKVTHSFLGYPGCQKSAKPSISGWRIVKPCLHLPYIKKHREHIKENALNATELHTKNWLKFAVSVMCILPQ